MLFESYSYTVKLLKIRTSEKIAVITQNLNKVALQKNNVSKSADGMANSVDPDQTAPLGAV